MSNSTKAYHHPLVWIVFLLLALGIFIYINKMSQQRTLYYPQDEDSYTSPKSNTPLPAQDLYAPPTFELDKKLHWLTHEQIEQHKMLYEGCVSKRNEITEKLHTIDLDQKGSETYSPYRALKIAETYAVNGSVLHELYFENIGGINQEIGPELIGML